MLSEDKNGGVGVDWRWSTVEIEVGRSGIEWWRMEWHYVVVEESGDGDVWKWWRVRV